MSDDTGEPIADPDASGSGPAAPAAPAAPGADAAAPAAGADRERRPILERIGLAAVAVVLALMFALVAVAAFIGGEYFLAAMGFVGCMMTLVVGGTTLLRG